MQVKLEKTFPIDAPAGAGWKFLQDIPAVAACMPGAEITDSLDDSHYKGKIRAKIGPAAMSFNGDLAVEGIDAVRRQLRIIGKGQDTKGSSTAEMDLTALIAEVQGGCELRGSATVTVNGKAASLGGRMMVQVADQILNQFGKNFATNVLALGEGETAEEAREQLAEQPRELNGLAFAWSVIVGFFKSLFGGGKAKAS
jgi:carbon monoxide dehydrogenase subunit G